MIKFANFVLLFISFPSFAAQVNSLQTGFSGPGYLWSNIDSLQTEAEMSIYKRYGSSTWSDAPTERLSAKTYSTEFSAASAFRPSKDFYSILQTSASSTDHTQILRVDKSSYSSNHNEYGLKFRSYLDRKRWLAGASVGLWTYGEETKLLSYNGQRRIVKIQSSTAPIFEIVGGARYFAFETMVRMQLFSQELAEASTTDKSGSQRTFDYNRVSPTTLNIATAWNGIPQLMLISEIDYKALGQLNETTDEYSSIFLQNGERIKNGPSKSKGSWSLSGGGKFFPSSEYSVKASATYNFPSYSNASYTSHELNNAGGWNFEGGCDFIPESNMRLGITLNYSLPVYKSFTSRAIDPSRELEIPRTPGSRQSFNSASWRAAINSAWTF